MRKRIFFYTIIIILALAATSAFANGTEVRLANGKVATILHPGQDGVSHPKVLQSSIDLPSCTEGEGKVLLAVLVLKDGSAADVMVVDSTAPGTGLEEAAIDAVGDWRFRPAKKKREPVDSYIFYEVAFRNSGATRAHPVWYDSDPERGGLRYGGMSGSLDSYAGHGRMAARADKQITKTNLGNPGSAGSGANTPAEGSSDFNGFVRALDVDWVVYGKGDDTLIDKRPRHTGTPSGPQEPK